MVFAPRRHDRGGTPDWYRMGTSLLCALLVLFTTFHLPHHVHGGEWSIGQTLGNPNGYSVPITFYVKSHQLFAVWEWPTLTFYDSGLNPVSSYSPSSDSIGDLIGLEYELLTNLFLIVTNSGVWSLGDIAAFPFAIEFLTFPDSYTSFAIGPSSGIGYVTSGPDVYQCPDIATSWDPGSCVQRTLPPSLTGFNVKVATDAAGVLYIIGKDVSQVGRSEFIRKHSSCIHSCLIGRAIRD